MDSALAPGPTRLGSPCTLELSRAVKSAAYSAGMTMSEWIRDAVEEKLGRVKVVEVQQAPEVRPEKVGPLADCPCGGKCVPWGPNQKHCTKCSRNFPI